MSEEMERDYYPVRDATAAGLSRALRAINAIPKVRYVWLGDRPIVEVQVKRSRLTDGSIVEDVLLIPGPSSAGEP